ncbi:hypothetical protein [Alistipes putredinis]|uniref:hypothetical protein n=1 Tax=Alistipes putredinis TaxID=28117 RepID=UPI003FD723A0
MKDTYYINKEYHTLVRVTYNTTQREYEVMDTLDNQIEHLSLAEFTERCKQRYEPLRRAKIVKLLSGEYATAVRSKSSQCVLFKTYGTYDHAYVDAIRNCLPLVTYVRSANGTAIGLNTARTVLVVSKYYKKEYALRRAFDREYNR